MMKNIIYWIASLIFAFIICYQFYVAGQKSVEPIEIIKTDTIKVMRIYHRTDTVPSVILTSYIKTIRDTLFVQDSIRQDGTIVVDIPIEQKVYSDDSTYTAYISGYKSSLDSISIKYKESIIQIEKTQGRAVSSANNKHWGIGVQVGYGYSPQLNKGTPYIGLGLSYNFINF